MAAWEKVAVVFEREPISIGGIDPWAHEWTRVLYESVDLPHPAYPSQRHRFEIYDVTVDGRTVRFAAGELSANVWGFYVPAG